MANATSLAEKHLKPYQGLKQKVYLVRRRKGQAEKHLKPYQGLKHSEIQFKGNIEVAEKHLKPYQGLKHLYHDISSEIVGKRRKTPKTLSGIETKIADCWYFGFGPKNT